MLSVVKLNVVAIKRSGQEGHSKSGPIWFNHRHDTAWYFVDICIVFDIVSGSLGVYQMIPDDSG
jgi:hypothetical protein